jgi:coenzyme Q-binding protein COQ10
VPSFRSERRVRHTADQMFDLVANVERYPEFVPLCTGLRVRERQVEGEGKTTLIADMSVGYKMIRERFTSRVVLDKPRLRVVVQYVDGPFSHLENIWTFKDDPPRDAPGGESSVVAFYIDYEFRSRLLGSLMGSMFDAAFRKFSQAFEKRADEVYGRR